MAVLGPGARVQPARPETGVLQGEEIVAGGHAGAAVADDAGVLRHAGAGQPLPQLRHGQERAVRGEVLAAGQAPGAGDVPGARIDRLGVTAVPGPVAGVQDDMSRIGGVLDAGQPAARPGTRREPGRRARRGGLPGLRRGLLWRAVVGLETAVEQRGGVPRHPQHPDQPGRDRAPGVVVSHDRAVVGDPEPGHAVREDGRIGQRVPARLRAGRAGEPAVEIHEHRARQVPGSVGVAARAAVQVPADVGEQHVAAVLPPPGKADHGPDHAVTLPGQMAPGAGPRPLPRRAPGEAQ